MGDISTTMCEDDTMWKYLNINEFLQMLELSQIGLTRASELRGKPGYTIDETCLENFAPTMWKMLTQIVGLSEWYLQPHESRSMWCRHTGSHLALRINKHALDEAFSNEDSDSLYLIEPVSYEDFDTLTVRLGRTPQNTYSSDALLSPFLYKSYTYDQERAIRAVVAPTGNYNITENGFGYSELNGIESNPIANVNLFEIDCEIIIAPQAPGFLGATLQNYIESAHGSTIDIIESQFRV